jgi:GT2 family glycosyltransferase
MPPAVEVGVVIATRNRRDELQRTLRELRRLPEAPPVVVVDNGSEDGTADAAARVEGVEVVRLDRNAAAAARNIGAQLLDTPFVAFADDDSWWRAGSLPAAARLLRAHPDVGLCTARILLGDDQREDPLCETFRHSPLGSSCPGPTVLGFVACAAVVRRDAFLDVGGFTEELGVGGEETLVALDLADRGLRCVYVDELVAHHHPSPVRDKSARHRRVLRNELWSTWLRLPARDAMAPTVQVLRQGTVGIAASRDAVTGWSGVRHLRSVLSREVVEQWRHLQAQPV